MMMGEMWAAKGKEDDVEEWDMKAEGSHLQKQVSTVTKCAAEWKDRASTERKQKTAIQRQTERRSGRQHRQMERLTGQKGERENAQHQANIVILYSSPAPMCWLWEHHLRLTTLFLQYSMPSTLPAPIALFLRSPTHSHRAHTIAVWWGVNDWSRNGVKRERITRIQKKNT